ncbi:uncharacterized protein TNCV_2021611 [Trichonephila clavipes]|nr:uncharacterized protein TNCV_2021611 [Trichonephila clavipes]
MFYASRAGIVTHTEQWLATLTAVPLGLGSNPGEDMDVCKCIVPSRHGGTLNSRRAVSPLVRLVEGEGSSVTRMVLKPTDNDRRHLALCHDEIRGP